MTGQFCNHLSLVVTLSLLAAPSARAAVLNVPAGHATIQGAIDAAVNGDEILVAPGTYKEAIDFLGKAITLRTCAGPDVTIIDGEGLAVHVVRCSNGEGPDTVLDGFTITGGNAEFVFDLSQQLGAGMYIRNSSPTVNNCTFVDNFAQFAGGGIFNSNSSPAVTDCTFEGNQATNGGGMGNYNGSNPTVTNCTFGAGNFSLFGGGMLNRDSSPTVTGCTFGENISIESGGGMHNYASNPTVINCTFSGNSAGGFGGNDIYNENGSSPTVTNSIFWGVWGDGISNDKSSVPTIAFSDLKGSGGSGVDWDAFLGIDGGGNIDEDPLFVDEAAGDLHLTADSLAINVGNNGAIPAGVATDLDGNPRIIDGTVDMGAYEWAVLPTVAFLADPSGSDKNRFLSFVVLPSAAAGVGTETAIQIELVALNHTCSAESDNLFEPCLSDGCCSNGICAAPFAASEGQFRYVNTVKTCQGGAASTGDVTCRSIADCAMDEECLQMRMCEGTTDLCATSGLGGQCKKGVSCLASMSCPNDAFKPPFLCATTGCAPEYRDWASDLAGGVLHVYGPGIVPARSEYNLRQIPAACAGNEASCASASEALMLATARWADMTADGATDARDITAASDKVKPIPDAFTKVRTMLIPGILNPFRNVNVLELQNTIDAVKSLPMPGFITGPEDCGG